MSDVGTLRRCPRCNLNLVDDTIECPLCHGVVELEGDEDGDRMSQESKSLTYPDVLHKLKAIKLIIRIVLFAAIVTGVIVLLVNYLTFNGVYWSLIVCIGLVYGCATLLYSVRKRRSIQRIIQAQMWFSIILVVGLDYLIGYKGWSFSYAIPIAFVALAIGMVVLMIIGIDGWQNYIMTEIVVFVLSVILMILWILGKIPGSIFILISLVTTGLILLGTVMFGQKRVMNEIKRRFMI